MRIPDNVNAQLAASVQAVAGDIATTEGEPTTALIPLALELLHREFGSFVLFCRLGDHDPRKVQAPDGPRAYGVICEGVDAKLDPKLARVIGDWLKENTSA